MQEESRFTIHLRHEQDYRFQVEFDWEDAAALYLDEPPPLGNRSGPNAARMLAAATANCLSASLLYCVREVEDGALTTEATCILARNDKGRLRIGRMDIVIKLGAKTADAKRLERCMNVFEDYCVVTASIRQGIPVAVRIESADGVELHRNEV